MVAFPRSLRLSLPVAPVGAVAGGCVAALACLLAPGAVLDRLAAWSGLPDVFAPATPPLGTVVHALAAAAAGLGSGAVLWAALFLLVGTRRVALTPRRQEPGAPKVRRADAHPDAPPRRPLFAGSDLGQPLPESPRREADEEQRLPADLDVPLAAYDPSAIPDQPREPVRAVAALARHVPLAPGERIESFDLLPEPASLTALLDRLENSARARGGRRPGPLPITLGEGRLSVG